MSKLNLKVLAAIDIAARVDRNLAWQLKTLPHSKPQIRMLLAVASLGQTSDAILAEQIGMSGPQLSRDVRPLIEEGLIASVPSERHLRQRVLSLTEEGQAAVARINTARLETFDDILPSLTPRDRAAITRLMMVELQQYPPPVKPILRPARLPDIMHAFQVHTGEVTPRTVDYVAQATVTLYSMLNRWGGPESSGFVLGGERALAEGHCFLMPGSMKPGGSQHDTMTMVGPYVSHDFRGRGYAKEMLERCVDQARDIGYDFLETSVSTRTRDLEKFLGKRAFRKSRATNTLDLYDHKSLIHVLTRKLR